MRLSRSCESLMLCTLQVFPPGVGTSGWRPEEGGHGGACETRSRVWGLLQRTAPQEPRGHEEQAVRLHSYYSTFISSALKHSLNCSHCFLQVHCVWRGGGPGCWRSAEGVVHDHLQGDVQSHVCTFPHVAWRPGHLHHKPLIPLQSQPPQLL